MLSGSVAEASAQEALIESLRKQLLASAKQMEEERKAAQELLEKERKAWEERARKEEEAREKKAYVDFEAVAVSLERGAELGEERLAVSRDRRRLVASVARFFGDIVDGVAKD